MTIPVIPFAVMAPLLALGAGALIILLFDLLMPAKTAQPFWYIFGLLAVVLAGYYLIPLRGAENSAFGGMLLMDAKALAFAIPVLGAAGLTILLSAGRGEQDKSGYLALVLWSAMGMILMGAAGNLMTIFLGLELFSLALYVMVAFDPARSVAKEAAFKYFILGGVASAFMLFGFGFLYGATGTLDLAQIAAAGVSSDLFFKVGLGLAIVGYAFKLALVPFHAWAPDVYQGAPTPVTAFMSVGTKAAAFAALARFLVAIVPAGSVQQFLLPLAVAAAFSMILGGSVAIWQTDLKRLMAYSGIAHAGYLMMALPGLTQNGMGAGAYYMTSYLFISMGVFGVISYLEAEGVDGSSKDALTGLWSRNKWLALALTVMMFGLIGLPPTSGFFGKLMLAVAALEGGGTIAWTVLVALMVSTGISAYAYLRVIGSLFKKNEAAVPGIAKVEELTLAPSTQKVAIAAVIVISLVGTLVLGLFPSLVNGLFGI